MPGCLTYNQQTYWEYHIKDTIHENDNAGVSFMEYTRAIELNIWDSEDRTAEIVLTAKQARNLARALIEAAEQDEQEIFEVPFQFNEDES